MAGNFAIGIDLGGTYIKGGVCDATGQLVLRHSVDTEADRGCDHVIGRMVALVRELIQMATIEPPDVVGVGVGSPGPLSHAKGIIHGAPNLPGFVNVPLRDRLSADTGLPVTLENDANAAAYGEFAAGAGQRVRSMVMLTLGTGIGGGVIMDGQLIRGAYDNAGELGHMIVVPGGRACPCGQQGCLERYASANAVYERTVEAVQAGESSSLADAVRAEERFDARDVLTAAETDDAVAGRIWSEMTYYLAIAAVNIQHAFNPELVVLAGGLINAGEKLMTPLLTRFEEEVWQIAPDKPEIALATLGTDAGTIGAAALAAKEYGQ